MIFWGSMVARCVQWLDHSTTFPGFEAYLYIFFGKREVIQVWWLLSRIDLKRSGNQNHHDMFLAPWKNASDIYTSGKSTILYIIPKPELRGLWEDSFTITTIWGDQPAGIGRCNLLRHMGFLVNSPWIIHQSYWFQKSSLKTNGKFHPCNLAWIPKIALTWKDIPFQTKNLYLWYPLGSCLNTGSQWKINDSLSGSLS